jgi:beta-1,4-mannosyltransferase
MTPKSVSKNPGALNMAINYRPVPFGFPENKFFPILTKHLANHGFNPLGFAFWTISGLFKNRGNCQIIYMHWPEGFWRSRKKLICYMKAIWFVLIFSISKLWGYKWVWAAHNVIPHFQVKSYLLERLMRLFILRNFDLTIGLAYNTENDLELAFGTTGKKYLLALLGTYEDSYPLTKTKEEFRRENGIPTDAIVLLSMNTLARGNKGIDDLLYSWMKMEDLGNVHLLLTGNKPDNLDQLMENGNFHYIEGRIPDKIMGSLVNSVDFLVLNYKSITTSSFFYLAVTFNLPIIAPNLPFFKLHASEKTALFFDYNRPLQFQLENIIGQINSGWEADRAELDEMQKIYNPSDSARKIAEALQQLSQ